jgi:hypothetical protein
MALEQLMKSYDFTIAKKNPSTHRLASRVVPLPGQS